MASTIRELAEKFTSKKAYYQCDKSMAKNLILGSSPTDEAAFLYKLADAAEKETIDEEDFACAVKETVRSYTHDKDKAIALFRNLQAFLERELKCTLHVDYPPVSVTNNLERVLFIVKYLHDADHSVDELEDVLWVSSRTIEKDLSKLRGNDGDPLQVCGKPFTIDDSIRTDGRFYFDSTVHPYFLTCNLTQVLAMLIGLQQMAEQPEWKGYADISAAQIWQQTSDYGRNRIRTVVTELMPQWKDLPDQLDACVKKAFHSERHCSSYGDNALLISMKSGERVYVEYRTDDGPVFYQNVMFQRFLDDNRIQVVMDGKTMELEQDRILRSAIYKESMM